MLNTRVSVVGGGIDDLVISVPRRLYSVKVAASRDMKLLSTGSPTPMVNMEGAVVGSVRVVCPGKGTRVLCTLLSQLEIMDSLLGVLLLRAVVMCLKTGNRRGTWPPHPSVCLSLIQAIHARSSGCLNSGYIVKASAPASKQDSVPHGTGRGSSEMVQTAGEPLGCPYTLLPLQITILIPCGMRMIRYTAHHPQQT